MIHTYVEAKCLNMAQEIGTRRFHRGLRTASGGREEVHSDSMDWSKLLTNFQFNGPSLGRQPCRPRDKRETNGRPTVRAFGSNGRLIEEFILVSL